MLGKLNIAKQGRCSRKMCGEQPDNIQGWKEEKGQGRARGTQRADVTLLGSIPRGKGKCGHPNSRMVGARASAYHDTLAAAVSWSRTKRAEENPVICPVPAFLSQSRSHPLTSTQALLCSPEIFRVPSQVFVGLRGRGPCRWLLYIVCVNLPFHSPPLAAQLPFF